MLKSFFFYLASITINSPISANGANISQNIPANEQIFHCIKYTDGYETGVLGTTPLGNAEVVLTDTSAYYEPYIAGTLIEYTIVILDN